MLSRSAFPPRPLKHWLNAHIEMDNIPTCLIQQRTRSRHMAPEMLTPTTRNANCGNWIAQLSEIKVLDDPVRKLWGNNTSYRRLSKVKEHHCTLQRRSTQVGLCNSQESRDRTTLIQIFTNVRKVLDTYLDIFTLTITRFAGR